MIILLRLRRLLPDKPVQPGYSLLSDSTALGCAALWHGRSVSRLVTECAGYLAWDKCQLSAFAVDHPLWK